MQLARIGMVLGLKPPEAPASRDKAVSGDDLRELMSAGLPIQEGRPDDPMLDFLDIESLS